MAGAWARRQAAAGKYRAKYKPGGAMARRNKAAAKYKPSSGAGKLGYAKGASKAGGPNQRTGMKDRHATGINQPGGSSITGKSEKQARSKRKPGGGGPKPKPSTGKTGVRRRAGVVNKPKRKSTGLRRRSGVISNTQAKGRRSVARRR